MKKTLIQQELERAKRQMLRPLDKVNPDKPIILYHGTSLSNFAKIKKEGIRPRGRRKSNWDGIGISRPDLVYLTNCYACYYASMALRNKKDKSVVIKVKIDPKETKLYFDEEFIYHVSGLKRRAESRDMAMALYATINPKNLAPWIKKQFKREITWVDSLNFMGTVACDYVPKENIISYSVLTKPGYYYCDPSVSPINYKFCSGMYIDHLERLIYKPFKAK